MIINKVKKNFFTGTEIFQKHVGETEVVTVFFFL